MLPASWSNLVRWRLCGTVFCVCYMIRCWPLQLQPPPRGKRKEFVRRPHRWPDWLRYIERFTLKQENEESLMKLLPTFIKRPAIARLKAIAYARKGSYFQSQPGKNAYSIKVEDHSNDLREGRLPVPPEELWLGYGPDAETYLSTGKRDVSRMAKHPQRKWMRCCRRGAFGICAPRKNDRHLHEFAPNAGCGEWI